MIGNQLPGVFPTPCDGVPSRRPVRVAGKGLFQSLPSQRPAPSLSLSKVPAPSNPALHDAPCDAQGAGVASPVATPAFHSSLAGDHHGRRLNLPASRQANEYPSGLGAGRVFFSPFHLTEIAHA